MGNNVFANSLLSTTIQDSNTRERNNIHYNYCGLDFKIVFLLVSISYNYMYNFL